MPTMGTRKGAHPAHRNDPMKSMKRRVVAAALLATGFFAGASQAAVIIHGTRVIYPSSQKEVTVDLENKGEVPALVQVWVDNGDEASPTETKAPFILTPPLSRIEKGRGQAIRIMHAGEPLPTDRESLFWLNMLDIPPKAADASPTEMNVAIKTRIKLLYRPSGLAGEAIEAPKALRWAVAGGSSVQVTNPTPYYVNFASVGIKHGNGNVIPSVETGGMVAPGATATFKFKAPVSAGEASVVFEAISDLGAKLPYTQPIAAGR